MFPARAICGFLPYLTESVCYTGSIAKATVVAVVPIAWYEPSVESGCTLSISANAQKLAQIALHSPKS